MNTNIEQMLSRYRTDTTEDQKNAIKEITQEIVLCGLSRAGFFQKAAFYGGTALRIFYGLDRFSEDLDFSLKVKDPSFSLADYFHSVEKEVQAYGLRMSVTEKEKSTDSNVKSAFVKGNTKELVLQFFADALLAGKVAANETVKIKFEVDTNPPAFASFETKFRLLPSPYEVCLYDMPSLFAGKIHAVICRAWKSRVKGRDLYDYIFYLSRNAKVNLPHLRARLVDSGFLDEAEPFDLETLKEILNKRFDEIDYTSAKEDVRSFIRDKASLDLWSANFFKQMTEQLEGQ